MTNNELIKHLREKMGISQKLMAEKLHMDARTYSRIESGARQLQLWEFLAFMELAGMPTEDWWVLYLDTKEYGDYITFKEIKRLLRIGKHQEAKEMLANLGEDLSCKHPFVLQFVDFVKIFADGEMPHKEAVEGLREAIKMSRIDFDEDQISKYRLTYNEIFLLIALGSRLCELGELDRAIKMYKAIIEARENANTSAEDKGTLFPPLLFNLSTLLRESRRLNEALKYSNMAREMCIEYNNMRLMPRILFIIAKSLLEMKEEENVYKTYLVRAYHCAYAIGDNETGASIKKYADEIGIIGCFS